LALKGWGQPTKKAISPTTGGDSGESGPSLWIWLLSPSYTITLPLEMKDSCEHSFAQRGIVVTSVFCQAEKSAVATVWKTKELKQRHGVYAKRELFRPFWKPSLVRAALLYAFL
jgi:hypothetical protein